MKKATLKDIAAKAGVSVALVSNYLNQRPSARMSENTKAKIDHAIAELDYRTSEIARSLRTGKSNIIGYVSESLRTEVAQNEMLAIFDAASEDNYQVFVAFSSDRKNTMASIRMLKDRGCDGIIVSGYFNESFSLEICNAFNNVVILNTYPDVMIPGKMIHYDYRIAVKEAISYLESKGHKEIVYQTTLNNYHEQRYLEFIEHFGTEKVWSIVSPTLDDWRNFFKEHPNCSAMLHLNDFIAMQTIQSCSAMNIKVPADLAVVGFDNIHAAECATPPLATICRPLSEAASCAVKALIAKLNGREYTLPESLPCKFIPRGSI